jgi:hypothetical protein
MISTSGGMVMKTKCTFLLLCLLSHYMFASEITPPPFSYMASATNRIEMLTSKSPVLDRETLIEINSEGCAALIRLIKDPNYKSTLLQLEKRNEESMPLRKAWAENENLFNLAFVPMEQQALSDAGLNKEAVASLMSAIKEHREAIARPFEAKEVIVIIEQLRNQLCESARKLQAAETAETEVRIANEQATQRANWWKGAAIIAADLSFASVGIAGATILAAPVAPAVGGVVAIWAGASVAVGIDVKNSK